MRLLQVMASNKQGGAELFFSRLCRALATAGVQQQVALRHDADCRAELQRDGIPIEELPFLFSGDPFTRWQVGRLARRFAPDAVLSWMSRGAAACPRGAFVHIGRLGGYYDLKYYRTCDHLIGNTEDIVRYLVDRGWPAERAHYLPNFVEESPAEPVSRQSLDTPERVPVLLALGRLHSDKAFDVLLNALALLPGVYLWLAGDGPLKDRLTAQSDALGVAPRVRFLGWRPDSGALLEAADILVCPSRIEPLGNVVLEGWVHRRPVVAAASSGPKVLIEHGRSGLVVPMEDAPALAEAIRAVLNDGRLAASLAQGGYDRYRSRFSRDAVVGRYLQFFEKVTGKCAALPA